MANKKDEYGVKLYEGGAGVTQLPAGSVPASYIDENGQKKNGIAQYDPSDPEENGAYWKSSYDFARSGYQKALDMNDKAAAAKEQRYMQEAQEQLAKLGGQYQQTNRQLYRDYMGAQRNLPQQLAAKGYTGGLSESSRVGLETAYGQNLAQNERSRLDNEADINAALARMKYDTEAERDAANAQAWQQYRQELAAAHQNEESEQNRLAALAAQYGDFSGYLAQGMSQGQVDYMTLGYLALNPKLKKAWIAAHPEDAARLGIKNSAGKNTALPSEENGIEENGTTPNLSKSELMSVYSMALSRGDTNLANMLSKKIMALAKDEDYERKYWAGVAGYEKTEGD